ncbi:MAG: HesA/MoeB/ThiF family protein [Hyphomonadaceae bacterium]|nr:HesA/MoeB/ThiF family protein [Hyphomonadaceae bacterium]
MSKFDRLERHKRHILLKEIGGPGLARLAKAEVTLIGAGALGGPCALYLAAAGVGKITIYDDDVVDLSNLQRQIQFSEQEIGLPKADTLARRLEQQNSDILIAFQACRFKSHMRLEGDIVIDATDTFAARYEINEAAARDGKLLVSGAATGWQGQVGVFTPGQPDAGPCYRCLVPELPTQADDCSTLGVVGAVTGMVGARMALETIRLLTNAGPSPIGWFWSLDGLSGASRRMRIHPDPECPICN